MPSIKEKLGLIAGNGKFPFLVLDAAHAGGYEVVVVAIKEEAFPEIEDRGAASVHWLSLGGKCEPISPSASAPRMASTSACRPTSPSECARKPRLCGTRTPQIMR